MWECSSVIQAGQQKVIIHKGLSVSSFLFIVLPHILQGLSKNISCNFAYTTWTQPYSNHINSEDGGLKARKISPPKRFNPWTLLPIANCSTNYQLLTNHSNMWFWNNNTFQNETGYISSPRVLSSVLRMLCTVSPCCLSFCIAAYVTASFVWLDNIRDTNEWYLVSCNTT